MRQTALKLAFSAFFAMPTMAAAYDVDLTKSVNPGSATLGDTLQYCITMNPTTITPMVDIAWVIDATGSMFTDPDGAGPQVSHMSRMRTNIDSFLNTLTASGLDYRNGLITFGDANPDPPPPFFYNYDFFASDASFKSVYNSFGVMFGYDIPERGLEALESARTMSWRPGADRAVIFITDVDVKTLEAGNGSLSLTYTAQNLINDGIVVHGVTHDFSTTIPLGDPKVIVDQGQGTWVDFPVSSNDWDGLFAALSTEIAGLTNVVITDVIPPELIPIAGTYAPAVLTGNTLEWTFSTVGQGAPLQVCFDAEVIAPFPPAVTNTASVTADDLPQVDSNDAVVVWIPQPPSPTFTFSPTATASPSPTFSVSPTATFTPTHTPTASETHSPTRTWTPTATSTHSPTSTVTLSATSTYTETFTSTATLPHTLTATLTATQSATLTTSPTPTYTRTITNTFSVTRTNTPLPTATLSFTQTLSSTNTHTPTYTKTATVTRTTSPTPTFTLTFTLTSTPTSSRTSTRTSTRTFTPTTTRTITPTFSRTATRTATPYYSPTATITISPTHSVSPTFSASPTEISGGLIEIRGLYPNPFKERLRVYFTLNEAATVNIRFYNVAGERIYEEDLGVLPLGIHTVDWKGVNQRGARLASGVYLFRMEAQGQVYGRRADYWEKAVVAR